MTTTRDKQNQLRNLHPYLYRRVKLKAIVHIALGLSIMLSLTGVPDRTELVKYLPYGAWGCIFLVIGMGILWGLANNSPKKTKTFLTIGFIHASFWLTALIVSLFVHGFNALSVTTLWAYLTYNMWYIIHDTGWEGVELIKAYRRQADER